jgi:hypothetical protein
MTSDNTVLCKQDNAGKKKHLSVIIPLKLNIIRRHESGKNQIVVIATCIHWIINCLWHKRTEGPVAVIYGIK